MKLLTVLSLLSLTAAASDMPQSEANRLADAIFKAENSKRFPYGVMVKYDHTTPRQACINTIQSNYDRWQSAGSPGNFVDYMAETYCPRSADPVGHTNWKRNVKFFMR